MASEIQKGRQQQPEPQPSTSQYQPEPQPSTSHQPETQPEPQPSTSHQEDDTLLEEIQARTFSIERPLVENYFKLEILKSRSFQQSDAVREITYKAKLAHPSDSIPLSNLVGQLRALFDSVIDEMKRLYGKEGVARVYIYHPNLTKEIIITPRYIGDMHTDDILDHIDSVVYSAGDIPADESLSINVAAVHFLHGGVRPPILNLQRDISRKRSIVEIKNSDDNLCLPRAIVVAFANLELKEAKLEGNVLNIDTCRTKYNQVRDSRINHQKKEAVKLITAVELPLTERGSLKDIPKYENHLKVGISIISTVAGIQCVRNSDEKFGSRKIFLFHSENEGVGHYDTITKVNGVFCCQYYCSDCYKGFKNRTDHKCKLWCKVCGTSNCLEKEDKLKCSDCNMLCRSKECYDRHKQSKAPKFGKNKGVKMPALCDQFWRCLECGISLKTSKRKPEQHECGEMKCDSCDQYHLDTQHLCYMRAWEKEGEPRKFIFFDFESNQESGEHIPNYVVAQSICKSCEDRPITENSVCCKCGSRCTNCWTFNKKHKEFEREPCDGCGKRQIIFEGKNTGTEFCKWLIHEQHNNSKVMAHNSRSYDAYFILAYMRANAQVPVTNIMSGKKIMYLKIEKGLNIDIIDSLNFLPMPLASLPKAFGLTELKKGYFPHFFNTEANQNVTLSKLPDVEHYGPDSMSKQGRVDFLEWYENHKNDEFNFRKEMKEYCVSDVNILLQACMKFRYLLMSETGEVDDGVEEDYSVSKVFTKTVDPFTFVTIASVCMGIFRSKFLKEEYKVLIKENVKGTCTHGYRCQCVWLKGIKQNVYSSMEVSYKGEWKPISLFNVVKQKFVKSPIALIPTHGYSGKDNHSKESLEWLSLLEKRMKEREKHVNIQHARSSAGEKVVLYQGRNQLIKYKLDGYFELDGDKFACEYYGCCWHGCLNCFPTQRERTMNKGKTMGQLHRETMLREKRLKREGYKLITQWSCEFAKEKRNDSDRKFLEELNIQDPINIRDAYFGGRTNALVLYKKCEAKQEAGYVDFTSLYPDILKYKAFPVGHPERIFKDFKKLSAETCTGDCIYSDSCSGVHVKLPYFGVMKVTILPPNDLIHPILPIKIGCSKSKKLKFPLCYTCASKESKVDCNCSDVNRQFTHTYCTPELEVALNMGYKIVTIHEVLHWVESETYDTQTQTGGLFTEYINTFLRLKQQASGYPQNVETSKEKEEYVQKYLDHEGIQLEKKSIEKNPGLRSLSKLALNSFYGKFGQRTNMKKTKFITEIQDLYDLWLDESKLVMDFHLISDQIIEVEFKHSEDFEPLSFNTNVVIAAFCTSWARLKLWGVMHKLGDRVLYHDTDSIIFEKSDTGYNPPLGEFLGDLTDELSCKELGCSKKDCSGHFIEEFVSCGPKNYTYRLNTGQYCCKVRGFSLNYKNSLVLNFDSMKNALFEWKEGKKSELITVKTEICRDNKVMKVYNKEVKKHYGVVYDKRRVFDNFTTIPYGFKQ